MPKLLPIAAAVLTYLLVASPAGAHVQTVSPTSEATIVLPFGFLTSEVLSADPRLTAQKIQITASHIYVGELMRQWTIQSGIPFAAIDDGKDVSGRWQVVLRLQEVTVADAMDALRSALSEQGAVWQWERSGTAPHYTYRLICPQGMVAHQNTQRQKVWSRFERQLMVAQQASQMTKDELQHAAETDFTGMLHQMATHPQYGEAATVFVSNLSREQQQSLGHATYNILVPSDALNAAGQRFVSEHPVDRNKPTGDLSVAIRSADFGDLFPGFYVNSIKIGLTPEMTQAVRDELAKGILLSGDARTGRVATAPIPTAKSVVDSANKNDESSVFHRALPAGVNVIAVPPQLLLHRLESYAGHTLEEVQAHFYEKNLPNKWRNDILLFHYTAGFVIKENINDVPSQALYDFARDHEKEWLKDKVVPLADLLQAAELGTALHWRNLSSVGTSDTPSLLRSMTILHATFALMAAQTAEAKQEMIRSKGARVDTLSNNLLKDLGVPNRTSSSARISCQVSISKSSQGDHFTTTIEWLLLQDTKQTSLKSLKFLL